MVTTTRLRDSFRLPARNDPAPRNARMLGVCGWVAGLGLAGFVLAVQALAVILAGAAPVWYRPAVVTVGLIGILLTVAAFTTIHRQRLPWLLLGAATFALATNLAIIW